MSKKITCSVAIIACILMLAMCLTGLISPVPVTFAAINAEEVTNVEITSYVGTIAVGEEVSFVAEVTYFDDETFEERVDNNAEWSSNDESVATVEATTGLVKGNSAGLATITASAGDYSASVEIEVVESGDIAVEEIVLSDSALTLYVNETHQLIAEVLPDDATNKELLWESSEPTIASVEDGLVTAISAGEAIITASSVSNPDIKAECVVTVNNYGEATLTIESLTMKINTSQTISVSISDEITIESAEWTASHDTVVSVAADEADPTSATLSAWRFGSSVISVLVTGSDGNKYQASAKVFVEPGYFYITGDQNEWATYDTEEAAAEAGLLLVEDEEVPGLFTANVRLLAYNGFQIVNNEMDMAWTTKLTPWWYSAEGSTDQYVDNTDDLFRVNSLGTYTIALDLTDGEAKITIVMESLEVTEIQLSLSSENDVLREAGDEVTLSIKLLPENAIYNAENLTYTVEHSEEGEGQLYAVTLDRENLTITIRLLADATENYSLPVTVMLGEALGTYNIAVAKPSETTVPVSSIDFVYSEGEDAYYLDVNNGGKAWAIMIKAAVNEDATIQGVEYSLPEGTTGIYLEADPATGNMYVYGRAFGEYKVIATAIGDSNYTADATVYVYSDTYYLIGTLNGQVVENWTSLAPDVTSVKDTGYENWALTEVDGNVLKYAGQFEFRRNDVFTVGFLGMAGNWYGAIDNAYLDMENSTYVSKNTTNIQIDRSGLFNVEVDLTGATPVLTVNYVGPGPSAPTEITVNLLLMRAGGAWLGDENDEGNILTSIKGTIINGEDGTHTLSFSYDFTQMSATAWPTIQFVTVFGEDIGYDEAGYFVDATWYGEGVSNVEITGDAIISDTVTENAFTNGGAGCELWFEGTFPTNFTVDFEFTFDEYGDILSIAMNFATSAEA